MPSRSIARVAARLGAFAVSPVSQPTQRRQRPRTSPYAVKMPDVPVRLPPSPAESNDAQFWESMRMLMVLRVGFRAGDRDAIRANILLCVEQQGNERLSHSDRSAWRKLAKQWQALGF